VKKHNNKGSLNFSGSITTKAVLIFLTATGKYLFKPDALILCSSLTMQLKQSCLFQANLPIYTVVKTIYTIEKNKNNTYKNKKHKTVNSRKSQTNNTIKPSDDDIARDKSITLVTWYVNLTLKVNKLFDCNSSIC